MKKFNKTILLVIMVAVSCMVMISCGNAEMSKEELGDGLYPMYEKGSVEDKWGYIDKTGEYVIEPQFQYAYEFSEGKAAVCDAESGLYGYIDTFGDWVIYPQFDGANSFKNGYAVISQRYDTGNGWEWKYGYIMSNGEVIIPTQYDGAYDFDENGYAVVCKADGEVYVNIDSEGYEFGESYTAGTDGAEKMIADVWDYSQGPVLYPDVKKNMWGYKNEAGEYVIQPNEKYCISSPGVFSDGMCGVYEEYSGEDENSTSGYYNGWIYGYMDQSGNVCIDTKFFSFVPTLEGQFKNGSALVRTLPNENGVVSYGYIDKKGKWIIKKEYDKNLDEKDLSY